MTAGQRFKVVMAKPGLDGHDRGARVVTAVLRDAGFEVVYLGLHREVDEIAQAAIQEGADVVGLSVLSGAHLEYARDLVAALEREGASRDIVVALGGTIPAADVPRLEALGVTCVFPVETPFDTIIAELRAAVEARANRGAA